MDVKKKLGLRGSASKVIVQLKRRTSAPVGPIEAMRFFRNYKLLLEPCNGKLPVEIDFASGLWIGQVTSKVLAMIARHAGTPRRLASSTRSEARSTTPLDRSRPTANRSNTPATGSRL